MKLWSINNSFPVISMWSLLLHTFWCHHFCLFLSLSIFISPEVAWSAEKSFLGNPVISNPDRDYCAFAEEVSVRIWPTTQPRLNLTFIFNIIIIIINKLFSQWINRSSEANVTSTDCFFCPTWCLCQKLHRKEKKMFNCWSIIRIIGDYFVLQCIDFLLQLLSMNHLVGRLQMSHFVQPIVQNPTDDQFAVIEEELLTLRRFS